MNLKQTNISLFKSATEILPTAQINLFDFLTSEAHRYQVEQFRNESDPTKKETLKRALPCATISGTFSKRCASAIVKHSQFICLDIDRKENLHIPLSDWQLLKQRFTDIANVAYFGKSCSGTSYFVVIPIAHPDRHKQHFAFLYEAFKNTGIVIDKSCSDVSRLRFVSYDPDAYVNKNAEVLTAYYAEIAKPRPTICSNNLQTVSASKIIQRAVNMVVNAPDGSKWHTLNKAAFLLGGYIAANIISTNEAQQALETAINSCDCKDYNAAYRTIERALKDGQLKPVTL